MSDASADAPKIHACLAVTGVFDLSELSALLRVEPAATGRVGEPNEHRPGKLREADLWHFRTVETPDFDWPGHLEAVLSIVRPHAAEFRAFCAAHHVEAAVHLVAYVERGTPVGFFPADVVREIADFGCALDIDLYA